ncbi:GNAT family N-acetyltransferase [Streptomyces millisiae]|uniref:GNAT family N-acetyltransferase n=1 Tax=Streptomyces millisiae TaxID=3075542 RepID=A0ABU2LS82_9ACTN|nr:GNAT family N-acetyltransferase [Streptomyces sp. DSM 44918]MDT0320118.1 GNAT family N-acetyltransferase [Streptomyces sp. DSM 44918]
MSSSASPSPAPLTSERLLLRPWTPAEVAAVLGEGVRPARWAADFPAEGDRVIAGLLDQQPAWLGEYGHRLIVERASGLVVGSIGLFWPPRDGVVEIGYGVVPSRRGRGYAAEATRVLAGFALAVPGVHTVVADVEPSNSASVRVVEKAGFERFEPAAADTEGNVVRFRLTSR